MIDSFAALINQKTDTGFRREAPRELRSADAPVAGGGPAGAWSQRSAHAAIQSPQNIGRSSAWSDVPWVFALDREWFAQSPPGGFAARIRPSRVPADTAPSSA